MPSFIQQIHNINQTFCCRKVQFLCYIFFPFSIQMSHFISGVQIEGPLLLQSSSHKIVKPRFRRYINSDTLESFFDKQSQRKILDNICQRFSQRQEEKIEKERQMFVGHKFSLLKRKLKSNLNPNVSGRSVQAYFEQQKPLNFQEVSIHPLNIKNLSENMPRSIQLEKKYRAKLNIKMAAISQAKQIQSDKQKYKHMMCHDMNRTSSPNFQKMMYFFEKLEKKKEYITHKTEPNCQDQTEQKFKDLINQMSKNKERSSNVVLKENKLKQKYCRPDKRSHGEPKRRFKHLTDQFELFCIN